MHSAYDTFFHGTQINLQNISGGLPQIFDKGSVFGFFYKGKEVVIIIPNLLYRQQQATKKVPNNRNQSLIFQIKKLRLPSTLQLSQSPTIAKNWLSSLLTPYLTYNIILKNLGYCP